MTIELTRGDTGAYKFQRIKNGEVIPTIADNIYFSIKKNFNVKETLLQKTINDMTFDEDGTYHFLINPEDTNNLPYGDYVFDIEIVQEDYVKTLCKGIFKLTEEVTFKDNEV